MTSDGIHEADWLPVRQIASKIVELISVGRAREAEAAKIEMLSCLDRLEARYGRRPSILATRADYCEEPEQRISLLKEAFALAKAAGDKSNCTGIASSLAQLLIEDAEKHDAGEEWLGVLADCLAEHWDDFEHNEYVRLKRALNQ
jgi:hypothetical protein